MYYALMDYFVTKDNRGHGFANTKEVVFFETRVSRDKFIEQREDYDYSCRPLSYKDARKFARHTRYGKFAFPANGYGRGYLITLSEHGKHFAPESRLVHYSAI